MEVIQIAIVVLASYLILFGNANASETDEDSTWGSVSKVNSSNMILAYIVLFADPFMFAMDQVLMRNIARLKHSMTVATYENFSIIPVAIPLAFLMSENVMIYQDFS